MHSKADLYPFKRLLLILANILHRPDKGPNVIKQGVVFGFAELHRYCRSMYI